MVTTWRVLRNTLGIADHRRLSLWLTFVLSPRERFEVASRKVGERTFEEENCYNPRHEGINLSSLSRELQAGLCLPRTKCTLGDDGVETKRWGQAVLERFLHPLRRLY